MPSVRPDGLPRIHRTGARSGGDLRNGRHGRGVEEAGLAEWVELLEGDALETIPAIPDVFDVVFLDGRKGEYELYFDHARPKLEPGALVVADNVLSHEATLGAYSQARQADPTLSSVTVPLDRGLELSVVLRGSL